MIEKSKNFIFKISLFYTLIFIIFIAVPSYFYTKLELKSYINEQNIQILEYTQKFQKDIYNFSLFTNKIFNFPKSFKYEVTLLDENKKVIFESKKQNNLSKKLSYETTLSKNRINAKYIIINKNISYTQIYLKTIILCLFISLFMFISIYFLIKASIDPFQKANEYLDSFFNDAMHELKTPLGIIQLNLEILDEKQPKTKEICRSINAVKNLFLVYEDIEYLIKQKSVKYNKEEIDFSNFLNQRLDQFDSLLNPKNLKFNLNIENNLYIYINRTHLQRVIDNTLSNAIKYSFKESLISINLHSDAKKNIIFSVHNVSNKIKNKKTIFNRYYKENHIKGGFGIGLNIVKNICDTNNILIEVDSTNKNGTTFKYYFLK
ncbi:two-component sensor histidine kinase [Malaciobacter molluscorum]|uniref:sensor histidine kinase n=1 Tax=Malaciobacter molluscorum TaxID=1032072 RepID=UPI00100AF484|nr:HAMP domain-containing sensor histidine kinase [Malaciobacter molluscorum]RXJ96123.1 two-component sensor histidine kinase [Malaciobacter molluscorum]